MKRIILFIALIFLHGCTAIPERVKPVSDFDANRYLGTWYEIARLDHSFERGLTNVSANYSFNEDGTIKVINRGWSEKDQIWNEAIGKAKFVQDADVGHLKVSFFGPFYSSYVVFYLEPDYSTALVSGYNNEYFWILSRNTTIPDYKLNKYLRIAEQAGFNTESLIFPFRSAE
ncbi:lipocalin family protein [Vibrio sp. MarTm2]|uniref:lipocalin family protein n=1 Tax=Vibrio sp. MarTm2 TaxID=2998831 RepID=UPI0022CD3453|nr:lipocalin family protein [Vibrio sp. MarTm2]MDA0129045.1 lipocalin family protein [Vibrio sp. MarTm2]